MARHFGSGVLWATPQQDAFGNAIANPTPFQFGILQDVALDGSFDEKLLYGPNGLPVDAGRGKGKFGLKAKFANINFLPFSMLFFGQQTTPGLITSVQDQVGHTAAAAVAIVPPAGNTFFANLGVRADANGTAMIRVATAPAAGQYTTDGNGNYVFSAADIAANRTVYIDYQTMNATAGQIMTINNLPMGLTPTFSVAYSMQRNGKVLTLTFPRVTASKLAMSSKQEDFMIPELDMSVLANDAGLVAVWSASE